jgi:hypothetical protein
METYTETPHGVIVEHNVTTNVNPAKKRKLRILYVSLGIGILLVVVSLVLLLM